MNTAGSEPFAIVAYQVRYLGDDQFAPLYDHVMETLDAAGGSIVKHAFEDALLRWLVSLVAGALNGSTPLSGARAQLNGHTPVTGAQLRQALASKGAGICEPWRPALMLALGAMEDADVFFLSDDGRQYVRPPKPASVDVALQAHRRRIATQRSARARLART